MYVGPEFGLFVILTRDDCIEIDWYCIICKCKSLKSFQFILLINTLQASYRHTEDVHEEESC